MLSDASHIQGLLKSHSLHHVPEVSEHSEQPGAHRIENSIFDLSTATIDLPPCPHSKLDPGQYRTHRAELLSDASHIRGLFKSHRRIHVPEVSEHSEQLNVGRERERERVLPPPAPVYSYIVLIYMYIYIYIYLYIGRLLGLTSMVSPFG